MVSGAWMQGTYVPCRATTMLRQELYELLKLNGSEAGGCNPNNLITAIKEQLNRDIPSEINHKVKQQVH